jgi:hypothetical protein
MLAVPLHKIFKGCDSLDQTLDGFSSQGCDAGRHDRLATR